MHPEADVPRRLPTLEACDADSLAALALSPAIFEIGLVYPALKPTNAALQLWSFGKALHFAVDEPVPSEEAVFHLAPILACHKGSPLKRWRIMPLLP
jgi:hypothetical protein